MEEEALEQINNLKEMLIKHFPTLTYEEKKEFITDLKDITYRENIEKCECGKPLIHDKPWCIDCAHAECCTCSKCTSNY